MYTNGNFEARLAALCLLGTLGLTVLLVIATGGLFFTRRAWRDIRCLRSFSCSRATERLLALFCATSFDRTVARGDEKFYRGWDCHIAYSVRNVERTKTIGNTGASGEFYGGRGGLAF